MAEFLRTLCVISCLASGIYTWISYYFFRNAKRTMWYSFLCITLALNCNNLYAILPFRILDSSNYGELSVNISLATFAMVVLCVNIYAGASVPGGPTRFHTITNFILLILTGTGIVASGPAVFMLFLLISLAACVVFIHASYDSYKQVAAKQPTYLFAITICSLMAIGTVLDVCFIFAGKLFVSFRVLCTPLLLIAHAVTMNIRYKESIQRTQKLTSSLSDTLERIQHSDNALMCTQMKADFLYKSLNLITQKCDEDPFVAEDLTISLSKYLRHTLNFQQLKGIVPLSNEIELTKAYIAIEKERNPHISFEYHFPNPLPEFHIPPLSIQPLVENAIEHGLAGKTEGAKVTITIIPYKDYFHIDVSDNGLGMDEDTVASLTESLHETARVGIYNIHTRLIKLFGKGVVISSAPGIGTSVSFVVPPDAQNYISKEDEA